MFLGTYLLSFSGKGRIVLPKKIRQELEEGEEIILTYGLDGCIWGFEITGWKKETQQQLEVPLREREGRDLRRSLFSGAVKMSVDKQGRVVIPDMLLGQAQIKGKGVYLIGAGDHFEIWNMPRWEKEVGSLVKGT